MVDAVARCGPVGIVYNRARMISASLTKHPDRLHAARPTIAVAGDGTGAKHDGLAGGRVCDAQPWFRIFNPITQ